MGPVRHPANAAPASQDASFARASSWQWLLAEANPHLPARSGCVTVIRAGLTGDGRTDLVIAPAHVSSSPGTRTAASYLPERSSHAEETRCHGER